MATVVLDNDALSQPSATQPGEPLLYLPGLDGTGRLLHRQPSLHEHYRVRCFSYPQHATTTYDELAVPVIRTLEEEGPGILLAESFGGAVALTVALTRPELVRRMVLVNTFAYFPGRFLIRLAAWLGPWLPDKPSHPLTRSVRGIFFFSPDIPSAERARWWERTADVPMRAFGRRFQMVCGLDLRPRLAAIRIPALVVAAPNDRVVPPAAGYELAQLLPRARLLRMKVGHAALIHPRLDVAKLLANHSCWPASTEATAAVVSGLRPG